MWVRCLALVALVTSAMAQASSALELADPDGLTGMRLMVLEDPSKTLSYEQVVSAAHASAFAPGSQPVINLGFSAAAHWFRLDILVAPTDLGRYWLADIDYPVLDSVDLYLSRDGELLDVQRSGDQIPPSKRPLDSRSLSFPLRFEQAGLYQLHLRVESQSSHTLPLRILSGQAYVSRSDQFNFWLGLYFGIITITALFSAVVAVMTRSGLFLDYSAFVLFAGLGLPLSLTGYGSQYLWGEWPWWSNATTPMSMGLALFFALRLTRRTLTTAEIAPKLDQALRIEQFICLGLAISPLVVEYALAIRLGTVMGTLAALSVILASLLGATKTRRTALLFLVAWSGYLLAVLIKVMTVYGLAPYTLATNYAMQIGLSVLIVALAAALGDLLKDERRQMLEAQLQSLRDASERKQAELAARTKTEFLAKMSHELRTPMNAVIGFSELGMRHEDPGKQREYLSQIHAAAKSLLDLINDILDFSKIEAGQLKLEPQPVSVPNMFDKLGAMFQFQADSKDIGLVVEYDPDVPQWIQADPLRLEQILINLLANAIKFTEYGGVEMLASMQPGEPPMLSVRVRDTGVGIRQEDQARLFQPFSQADESITRRYGGTGLGLVICKQLVSIMGGKIGLRSEPGEGSEFWFHIPVQELDADELAANLSGDTRDLRPLTELEGVSALRGKKILLAEDNPLNQKLIFELLSDLEVELTTVENGRLAVAAAAADRFDLILMDVFMPEMDGFSATRAIRTIPKLASVPIIAVSASVAQDDQQSCFDAGMTDFVAKPVRSDELITSMLRQLTANSAAAPKPRAKAPAVVSQVDLSPSEGLSYCNNNAQLYWQVLEDFLQRYRETGAELQSLLRNGDRAEARRLAHTIKGLAASLGMGRLHFAAKKMERSLATADADPLPTEEFVHCFSAALLAADDYLAKQDRSEAAVAK